MSQPPGFKSTRIPKKERILAFLRKEESKSLSDQEIAERFGVVKSTINIYRNLLRKDTTVT